MTAPWEHRHPEGWRIAPLSAVVRETRARNKGLIEKNLLSLSYGSIVRRDIGSADGLVPASYETYQIVEPGQVVLRMTDLQNDTRSLRSGAVAERGIITSAYIAIESVGVMPAYLAWLLRGYDHMKVFYSFGGGVRQSLTFADLKRLPTVLPPEGTQRRIADYLDRETATIDALIEKQRQLSDALRTRRRASVLARTGFLGVKPASAASSEPWLESAPSHWSRMHVRRLFDLTSGAGFPPELQGVTDEELAFYKVRDLGRTDSYGRLGEPEDTISRETADKLRAKVLPSGTLVMAKIGAALLLGRIRMATRPSCIDNNMLALSPKSLLYPRYATYMLEGLLLDRLVQPGAVPSLNEREFRRTVFPIPPLDEQREIADHLDRETAKIDALIAKAERFIELARERRAALITAAVTGQIEIPTED